LNYFRNESLSDRLGDLEIPDSEVENYVEALEAGRHIVAYFAKPDTLSKVEELFRNSGLAKVKVF
jgi:tRNA A58 N-methylase Trm61